MSPTATVLRLGRACRDSQGPLAIALLAVAVLGLAQLYLTWLVKEWVEGPLLSGDRSALVALSLKVAIAIGVGATALFTSRHMIVLANQRLVERLRNQALDRLLSLEVSTLRRFPRGDLIARLLSDAGALSTVLSVIVRRVVREAIVYVGACVMMFVLNWRLTLAAALLIPILAWLMIRIGQRIRGWRARAQAGLGLISATLSEQLHGFTTIKGYRAEEFERQRFTELNAQMRRQIMQSEAWIGLLAASVLLVTGVGMLAVLSYATVLRGQGDGYSALLAFCLYGAQLIQPLRTFGEVQGFVQQAVVSAGRLFEIIDLPVPDSDGGHPLVQPVRGRIVFDRVHFAYDAESFVLNDLSLSIEPGERIGLVGATGSGKSTLTNLLLRHLHPSAGAITLDDQAVSDLRLADLRGAISVVEQEPFLFSGPLLDNIRYGTGDAKADVIERAVHLSGLDGVLPRLRRGLHTHLAEAGTQLSGGEKQRVALARAIVKGSPVLVLDEATSAIDGKLEAEMFARLDAWLAERTVVIIGHRFSTVRRCPRIVVLEGGTVIGDGSVTQLLGTCPRFVSMFAEQIEAGPSPTDPDLVGAERHPTS